MHYDNVWMAFLNENIYSQVAACLKQDLSKDRQVQSPEAESVFVMFTHRSGKYLARS